MNNLTLHRWSFRATVTLASLLSATSLLTAAEEVPPEVMQLEAVPADLKNWTIRFEGMGGHGGDTHFFRVALTQDGAMKVEMRSGKRGQFRKVFEGRLKEAEATEMLRVAARVVNDFRHDQSEGEAEDGWEITLRIWGESFKERSVKFSRQPDLSGFKKNEAIPDFLQLAKLINKHLKRDKILD